MKRPFYILTAVILLTAGSASTVLLVARQPERTAAMRGKQLADSLGCFACHGPEGWGGVADPTSPSGLVPDWRYQTLSMYIASEQELRDWILLGAPRSQAPRQAGDEHRQLIPMPAYERDLSPRQVADLVAYVLAVSGWRPEIPDEAYEGRKLAVRWGCFGCHGPSGMGGVPNPGSFKGTIPPWTGRDFADLVRDDDELRQWILTGEIPRLRDNPAARFFLARQKTAMPGYQDHLSDAEVNLLVAYIRWLRAGAAGGGEPREAATVIGTLGW